MTCVSAVGRLLGRYTDTRKGVEANVLLSKIIGIYSNVVFKIKQNHPTSLSSLPQKKKREKTIHPPPRPQICEADLCNEIFSCEGRRGRS